MNQHYKRVLAEFGPDTRFELQPEPAAPFRAVQESRFEQLKKELLAEQFRQAYGAGSGIQVRRAANEAAALAWVTPYPLLVFPTLFEEKVAEARAFAVHQAKVWQRSRELLVA